jgi:hypothetical protein
VQALLRITVQVVARGQSATSSQSVGTVIEESDESLFWLEYMGATDLLNPRVTQKLRSESNELVAIFTASQKTARANYAREKALRRQRRRE